jgi:hypothetical protein
MTHEQTRLPIPEPCRYPNDFISHPLVHSHGKSMQGYNCISKCGVHGAKRNSSCSRDGTYCCMSSKRHKYGLVWLQRSRYFDRISCPPLTINTYMSLPVLLQLLTYEHMLLYSIRDEQRVLLSTLETAVHRNTGTLER